MKNREELIQDSKYYFKDYPKEGAFHAVQDGTFFKDKDKTMAEGHAKSNKVESYRITREEAEAATSSEAADLKAKEAADAKTKADQEAADLKAKEETEAQLAAFEAKGEPSESWLKDDLISYGTLKYPELKLTKNMLEATILVKLNEAKLAAEAKA